MPNATMTTGLGLHVLPISLVGSALTRDDPRPERLYRAIESTATGESMRWEILPTGRFEELSDREARLRRFTEALDSSSERLMDFTANDLFPTISNGKRERLIAVTGFRNAIVPGIDNRELFIVCIDLPTLLAPVAERLLVAGGDALAAWYGETTPAKALSIMKFQLYFDGTRPEHHPSELVNFPSLGLPKMKAWDPQQRPDPRIPSHIGWTNYWSEETCAELSFPDPAQDERILKYAYQTALGGWIVKLTADPLDVTRPEHVEMLQWAYRRFDRVGIRCR